MSKSEAVKSSNVSAVPAVGKANGNGKVNLDHLPQALLDVLKSAIPLDSVADAAPHDLDASGRYVEGYLVLTGDRLGAFSLSRGAWSGQWLDLAGLKSAAIIDGLGMSILRIMRDGKVAAEHRFTLRHAKEVARLHRKLENKLEGKTEEDFPASKPDEKKVRCDKCDRVIPAWSEVCPACLSRRKVLMRLLDYVKPYKWRAIGGLFFGILVTVMGLARGYLAMPMFNDALGLGRGKHANFGLLVFYVVMLAVLLLGASVMQAVRERLMATLGSRVGRDIREKTYQHLHKLALSFFSRKPTGSLVTRVTSDSDRIWDFVAFTVIEMVLSFLTIVGVGVVLFVINWKLACYVLLPIPLMLVLTVMFHKMIHRRFDRLWHRWSQMTSVVADALPGVRVIKAFSQEKREVDRFNERNTQYFNDEVGMIGLWTTFGPVMGLCSQVGGLMVWLIGGYWVIQGWMEPGVLIAYTSLMWMFYGPIHMIAHMDRMLNRAASSVQRIFEILDTEPAIFSRSDAVPVQHVRGEIELRNVSFSYDGVRKVLKDVSLKMAPGEMIGLAGPSGGGKTTMINLICRFYDVLEGQILIDGKDIRDYDVESLRRRIGVVLQEPFLFHGTVARNIAYGNPEATLETVIAAAQAANAHNFIVGFPDGYDTMIGERGHTLSGGERQRISIARAILSNPSVLILDEATSSVDTETEKLIQEALDRVIANRTTIAIAHRLSTLRKAQRLVILDKGQIVEQGSHEELTNKEGGTYAKLIRMQTQMQSIIAIA